ncbi:universal stress protein [Escherichia coli]|nr:universal stress protein [Escherichia coli]
MYQKVLVPIALDHVDTLDTVLALAKTLAGDSGELVAMTVIEPISGYVAQYLPADQEERSRQAVLASLDKALADHPEATREVVVGHAGRRIVDYAEDNGCDCIIIASHQPGLQDYFLGSTAARVVRHAHCAVHVIR